MSLVKEIVAKVTMLPTERQQEVLDFVEFIAQKNGDDKNGQSEVEKKPFRSVFGILQNPLENFEADLAEVRREMWRDFPREMPK